MQCCFCWLDEVCTRHSACYITSYVLESATLITWQTICSKTAEYGQIYKDAYSCQTDVLPSRHIGCMTVPAAWAGSLGAILGKQAAIILLQ